MQEVIQDKKFYFLKKLDKILIKSSIYNNYLKKFWLQDSHFDILNNSNKENNKNQDSDYKIVQDRKNDTQ